MAIKIKSATGVGLVGDIGGTIISQEVIIIADTEAEIQALGGVGEVITDGHNKVRATEGSTAYAAEGGELKTYMFMPTTGWQKI